MEQRATSSWFRAAFAVAVAIGDPVAAVATGPPPAVIETAGRAAAVGDATSLLRVALDHLRSLRSFSANGESVGPPGDATRFSLRLGRPNLYRITWTRSTGGDRIDRVVWNSGEGSHVYSAARNAYVREKNDSSVFATEAGVSNGLTRGLPTGTRAG